MISELLNSLLWGKKKASKLPKSAHASSPSLSSISQDMGWEEISSEDLPKDDDEIITSSSQSTNSETIILDSPKKKSKFKKNQKKISL